MTRGDGRRNAQAVGVGAWSVTTLPWRSFFGIALALYAALAVSRIHEVIPILGRFYAGKTLALLLFAAIAVDGSAQRWAEGLKTSVAKCIGVILLLAVLSIPGSVWPRASVMYFQNQWPQSMLLFVCIMAGFANRRTAYVTIAAVTFTAALGALEMVVGGGAEWGGRGSIASDSSITYDANATAALFAGLLPYLVMFARARGKLRAPAIASIPIVLIAILKTVSRGGAIALAVCAVTLVVLAPKKHRKYYIAMLVVMAVVVILAPHQGMVERFSTLSDNQDYNFNARDGRIEVWKRGLNMMFSHPFLGIGVTAYMYANGVAAHSWVNAHNALVQIGAELGVGGFIAFCCAIVTSFKAGLLVRRKNAPTAAGFRNPQQEFEYSFATAALCSLITTVAAAMFLSMAYDTITLLAFAVPAALTVGSGASLPAGPNRVRGGIRRPQQQQPSTAAAGWRTARRLPRPALPQPNTRPTNGRTGG